MISLDRAKESFTSTGTGTINLGGAPIGWRTLTAALSTDYGLSGSVQFVLYFMIGDPAGADANNWEFGYGTVDTAATPKTLTRNLLASSTGALISWAAGTKYVFSTPSAFLLNGLATTHRGSTRPAWARAGLVWADTTAGVTDVRIKYYDGAGDLALFSIDETNNRVYPLDLTGAKIGGAQADVASAATTNIGAAASDRVRITGTTTITAFDSVADGVRRKVRFADSLTLTHNATSLILPGGQNITTAADDEAEFVSLGSGNWKCVDYARADGQAVNAVISPAQLTANTDNYNPTGLNLASVLRLSTDASRNLTGLVAPTPDRVQVKIIENVGSNDLVLVHDATSTAANRFYCPNSANFTLKGNSAVAIRRDPTSARWRVIALPAASEGKLVAISRTSDTTRTSTTNSFPEDDTKPQNTEGAQWTTLAHTPANAANILEVEVLANMGDNGARPILALFKDSDADALAATMGAPSATSPRVVPMPLKYYMAAGGTSAITFKVRFGTGSGSGGTAAINGGSSGRTFGGAEFASIIVKEYSV